MNFSILYLNCLFMTIILTLSGCQALPQLFTAAENIADDTAVQIAISKEACQENREITANVVITPLDPKK